MEKNCFNFSRRDKSSKITFKELQPIIESLNQQNIEIAIVFLEELVIP